MEWEFCIVKLSVYMFICIIIIVYIIFNIAWPQSVSRAVESALERLAQPPLPFPSDVDRERRVAARLKGWRSPPQVGRGGFSGARGSRPGKSSRSPGRLRVRAPRRAPQLAPSSPRGTGTRSRRLTERPQPRIEKTNDLVDWGWFSGRGRLYA